MPGVSPEPCELGDEKLSYNECLAKILSEAHLRCAMRKGFLSCRHHVAAIVGGHCVRKGFQLGACVSSDLPAVLPLGWQSAQWLYWC